jgi:peptidoglycan-associated lipoprotein
MSHQRRLAVLTLSAAVVVAAACAKKAPPPPEPVVVAPTVNQDSIDNARREQMRQDSIARARQLQEARDRFVADSTARAHDAEAAAATDAANMRNTLGMVVNFDYDKADLRDDSKQMLDAKIPILTTNTGVTLRIAGHTDARGSGEYNLQLGQRRAAAVRDYLAARGVAASRVELVSYGEERPLCQTKDEGCYSQNRRAEFEITAGGANLRRP